MDDWGSNATPVGPIHLILDKAPSHRARMVATYAERLNIILHFIPGGYTELLQPLDVRIFGHVKQQLSAFFSRELAKPSEERDFTVPTLMHRFNTIFNNLTPTAVKHAWACLLGDIEDDVSDGDDETFEMGPLNEDDRDDDDSDFAIDLRDDELAPIHQGDDDVESAYQPESEYYEEEEELYFDDEEDDE